jgi:hypothetical protein
MKHKMGKPLKLQNTTTANLINSIAILECVYIILLSNKMKSSLTISHKLSPRTIKEVICVDFSVEVMQVDCHTKTSGSLRYQHLTLFCFQLACTHIGQTGQNLILEYKEYKLGVFEKRALR